MKREIVFKGKRAIDGKWIKGFLTKKGTYQGQLYIEFSTGEGGYTDWHSVKVNPETVCQFTGLLDKNGNKIFEGDKAICEFGDFTVKFIDGCFFTCFTDHIAPLYAWNNESEIIGNIHD